VFSSTGVGFIVGAIPGGILNWPLQPSLRSMHNNSWVKGVPTVIDGIPTAAGWFNYFEQLIFLGSFGALGGFVFWIVLRWTSRATPSGASDGYGSRQTSPWDITRPALSLAVVAVLLSTFRSPPRNGRG